MRRGCSGSVNSPCGRFVSLCSEDGVYIIRLNRPETKNAFNQQLYDEICLSLMAAEEDDRVVMVRFFAPPRLASPRPLTVLPRLRRR